MKHMVDILINTRDRHSELALLLQSLRTQTFQNFNILVCDESSTPIFQSYMLMNLINRIKLENHKMKIIRNENCHGVCFARNLLIEAQIEFNTQADLILRLDDDIILERDYIEKLIEVIDRGYDLASGVVPSLGQPELIRKGEALGKIINEHKLDKEGNLVKNDDECGFCYDKNMILPTHQFRTNCLYKAELHEKGIRYPSNLSFTGFREEGFFSFKAILKGYKIGIHTGAIAYHYSTPSGGVRCENYRENVKLDEETWRKWIKKQYQKRGDFLCR